MGRGGKGGKPGGKWEKKTRNKERELGIQGTRGQELKFLLHFWCFLNYFHLPVDLFLYVITSKLFAVKPEVSSLHCCVHS